MSHRFVFFTYRLTFMSRRLVFVTCRVMFMSCRIVFVMHRVQSVHIITNSERTLGNFFTTLKKICSYVINKIYDSVLQFGSVRAW